MERVAFLIEPSQQRIGCLLNPETLLMRRSAGFRPLGSASGRFTGTQLADDPLLFTGGGCTEIELDLLFDISLAGSSITSTDVRDLTGPIWGLAENRTDASGYGRPMLALLVWGKAFALLGVVTEVAERLEHFDAAGTPRRSWLRLRMRRTARPTETGVAEGSQPGPLAPGMVVAPPPSATDMAHQVVGDDPAPAEPSETPPRPPGPVAQGERLDSIAARYYGDRPWLWRYLAAANDLQDPPWVPPGTVLRIPAIATGAP